MTRRHDPRQGVDPRAIGKVAARPSSRLPERVRSRHPGRRPGLVDIGALVALIVGPLQPPMRLTNRCNCHLRHTARMTADTFRVDPDRLLPDSYFPDRVGIEEEYGEALSAAFPLPWPVPGDRVSGLLKWLPIGVARDITAAAQALGENDGWLRGPLPSLSGLSDTTGAQVRTVLAPPAILVGRAALQGNDRRVGARELTMLAEWGEAFAQECVATVRVDGAELALPFVPRVRTDDGTQVETTPPPLGWLRLAYGATSGRTWHHPNCRALRGSATEPAHAPTVARWQLEASVAKACERCGGPTPVIDADMVAFCAAVSVWAARGDDRPPEDWQITALQHLLARVARQRAEIGEADVPLTALLLDGLAHELPSGEVGWDAYEIVDRIPFESHHQRDTAARQLCVRRLRALHELLPRPLRPEVPAPLDNPDADSALADDPQTIDDALRHWWRALTDAAPEDLELAPTVFGLLGAFRP